MENIHNYESQLKGVVERIQNSENILEVNKKTILRFKEFLLSENLSPSRIISYLNHALKYARMMNKPFSDADKDDIREIIANLNQLGLSENTKKGFKITLKRLYRFMKGITQAGVYPKNVEWLSVTIRNNHNKMPEELLTEEEVIEIIKKCKTLRDRALISVLAESGCRISEIALMKIRSVSFEEYGARLHVNGKTGMRKILIVNSSPYLQEWINQHPNNDDPNAYLWFNPRSEVLSYTRIAYILKSAVRNAGIKKRVYPHLFRHSRATFLSNLMSDGAMNYYFGWTQGSNMTSTYVHMSGKDTDGAILEANGIKIDKELHKPKMEPKKCLKCKTVNEVTNRFCKICGLPLDKEDAEKLLNADVERQQADNLMNNLIKDPEVLELIKKKLSA